MDLTPTLTQANKGARRRDGAEVDGDDEAAELAEAAEKERVQHSALTVALAQSRHCHPALALALALANS